LLLWIPRIADALRKEVEKTRTAVDREDMRVKIIIQARDGTRMSGMRTIAVHLPDTRMRTMMMTMIRIMIAGQPLADTAIRMMMTKMTVAVRRDIQTTTRMTIIRAGAPEVAAMMTKTTTDAVEIAAQGQDADSPAWTVIR